LDKHKSKEGFDKEALKKRFLKKAKAQQRAFLASLSDLDNSGDERASLSSSNDELERKVEERLNGLCFFTDSSHGGLCTIALGHEETGKNEVISDDDTPKVLPSTNKLTTEVDALSDALLSQDRLLKHAARERKEYKERLEQALKDLELARSSVSMTEEIECDTCAIHMSSLVTLQNKYGTLLDEHDELKARSILLGACKSYSGLQSELAEKNDKISALEKASSDSTAVARCALCESLELELESCKHDKMRYEEENTYLRTILSWVSCSEP